MTFKEVYNLTTQYYPSEINISDGKMTEKDNWNFNALNEFWDNAELKSKKDTNLVKLMVWAIYCAFYKQSVKNFLKNIKTVSLSELDMKYLKTTFNDSLFSLNISLN